MSRTVGKATYLIKDIWSAYAQTILDKNPGWWSRYRLNTKHYNIGYYDESGKMIEVNSYPRFRKTIEHFFDRAKREIIEGNCINLNSHVGKILGLRVQRDFRKPKQRKIDWNKTSKYPKVFSEEKQRMVFEKVIYFTDDDWCRIAWIKTGHLINQQVYEFVPTSRNSAGTTGFRLEFAQAQRADKLLQYRYLYSPIKLKKKKEESHALSDNLDEGSDRTDSA